MPAPWARSRAAARCRDAPGAGGGANASPILVWFLLPSSGRIRELKSPLKLPQKVARCNLRAHCSRLVFCPHRFYLPFGVIFPLAVGFPQIQPRISHVEGITYVSFITHGSLDVSAPCNAQLKGSKKKKKSQKMNIL